MYNSIQTLREKDITKRVGTLWYKDEEVKLLRELSQKISLEDISQIHQRTFRGILLRRNMMIQQDIKKNMLEEEICNKYNISELEYQMILSENSEKIKKKSKEEIHEQRIAKLETEITIMNRTLLEIRDYLKLLTISNNINKNPFEDDNFFL
jgi:hypothetical protein